MPAAVPKPGSKSRAGAYMPERSVPLTGAGAGAWPSAVVANSTPANRKATTDRLIIPSVDHTALDFLFQRCASYKERVRARLRFVRLFDIPERATLMCYRRSIFLRTAIVALASVSASGQGRGAGRGA